MDRMPNPKRPIIGLTPRKMLAAAAAILIASYVAGALLITSDPPVRKTEFAPNFDAPGVVVVPPDKPEPPTIELEVIPEPEAPAGDSPRHSSI